MNNKKEIAFVITSMGRGGAERVVSILANYYASINWKVHIIMLWHDILSYELDPSIELHYLDAGKGNPYLKLPRVISKLRKKIKTINPCATVAFIAQNAIVAYFACIGLDTRLIVSERIDPSSMNRGKMYSAVLNMAYAKADVTVLQTQRAKNFFPEKVQKNSTIIYNPVTVNLNADTNREKIIITAGRLTKQKNHKMLISAFARFCEKFPDYELHIYGDGALREELEQFAAKKGLRDKVKLPGISSEIHSKMCRAEMFVLSSNKEGMSNALMEAMAIGLPCISTACSGSDELILNRENGLLVDVDDEDAMLNAMLYMAENRNEAELMGQKARELSAIFATEAVIDKWRQAIEGENYEH